MDRLTSQRHINFQNCMIEKANLYDDRPDNSCQLSDSLTTDLSVLIIRMIDFHIIYAHLSKKKKTLFMFHKSSNKPKHSASLIAMKKT